MNKLKIMVCSMILLLSACDRSMIFDEHVSVDEKGWKAGDKLVFDLDADDTTANYVCFVDIRNRNDYKYSNIYLSLTTIYPDGSVAADTNIEFVLAQPDGKWLGRESGRYIDGRYPFCYFRFPKNGAYRFEIGHAMRDTILAGVSDIGLVIKRTGK